MKNNPKKLSRGVSSPAVHVNFKLNILQQYSEAPILEDVSGDQQGDSSASDYDYAKSH